MPGTLKRIWSELSRPGRSVHRVEASHVECPFIGRVSVDHCLSCGRLRDIKIDGEGGWVACSSAGLTDPQFVYRPLE